MSAENRIILAPTKADLKSGAILVTIKCKETGKQKTVVIASKNPDSINPRTLIPTVLPAWEVVKVVRLTNAEALKEEAFKRGIEIAGRSILGIYDKRRRNGKIKTEDGPISQGDTVTLDGISQGQISQIYQREGFIEFFTQ